MELKPNHHSGWLEVVCGPMFSGKSEELIRRLRRARIARQEVMAFKPRIDNRYADAQIASHSQQVIECVQVDRATDIMTHLKFNTEVVGIDEVQFLGDEVVPLVQRLADRGLRIICAGLDMDYRGVPWEPVPQLMALAEYVQKTLAICMVCGNPASRTQRKVAEGGLVLIGASESYEARCRRCHTVDEQEQTLMFPEPNGVAGG